MREFLRLSNVTSARMFLERVSPVLERDEEKYALPLGVGLRHYSSPEANQQDLLCALVETASGETRAAALRTAPHYLIVWSDPVSEPALEMLADSLSSRGTALPGVTGPADASACFAGFWCARAGVEARLETRQQAYALRTLNPVRVPDGALRKARPIHAPLILCWINAMILETGSANQSPWTSEDVSVLIRSESAYLWFSPEGPAAMAYFNRPTRHSVAISGVFTPPEKRGNGFATALVAGMCARALNAGREIVTLFTDAANPISNAVYRRVGFHPVCVYHQYRFLSNQSALAESSDSARK